VNWDALGAIAELLGAIAVLATLAYLSIQIRANTSAVRAESRRSNASQNASFAAVLGSSKEAASVFRRGLIDPDALDPDEKTQFTGLFTMLILAISNAFAEYELGIIDDESLESSSASLLVMLETPGGHDYWKTWRYASTPGFRSFVDAKRRDHQATPAAQQAVEPAAE
jgi:hypothetical protein